MEKEQKVKKEKIKKEIDPNKVKFSEKLSLRFRRDFLVNKTITLLIVLILVAAFVTLNIWTRSINLPSFDVTENKLYSLSDASKKALAGIEQDTTVYIYGFEKDSAIEDFMKQYDKASEKVHYEILTEESNISMVQEYGLAPGYQIIIVKCGDSDKIIDPGQEFVTYDNTTYQSVDITEQVLTNSILGLQNENKPIAYFLNGHGEFSENEVLSFRTYLQNEGFQIKDLNLLTVDKVPDDADIVTILSLTQDMMDVEADKLIDFANRGGNFLITNDVVQEGVTFPNYERFLAIYGTNFKNGYVYETEDGRYVPDAPYIFKPEVSISSSITMDIYTDSFMYMAYSTRINYASAEELQALKVETEPLIQSSEKSFFITTLSTNLDDAVNSSEAGKFDLSTLVVKTIDKEVTDENGEVKTEQIKSKAIFIAGGAILADYPIEKLSSSYPISYIGSNRDYALNSMNFLGERKNTLTIRKDMSSSSVYTATPTETAVVQTIIFAMPLIIIVSGLIIAGYRKKRK